MTKLCPSSGLGYLGLGDSLRGMQKIQEALASYKIAINIDKSSHKSGKNLWFLIYLAYLKRGTLLYQLKMYELAIADLEKVINSSFMYV